MTVDEIGLGDRQKFLPEGDGSKQESVRFESGGKDDSLIEFAGLSKEEVMKYGDDPAWVRARWVLFATFWIVWLVLLAAAVALVVTSPKCAVRPRHHWWQKEVVYQLDVEKFKDANGDGVGDLEGLRSKISYFKELGVKTLSLSFILNATEPKSIASKYGDMNTLRRLRKDLREEDMHMLLEIPADRLGDLTADVYTYWLEFVDGIRVTGLTESPDAKTLENLESLNELGKKVSKSAFREKFVVANVGNSNATSSVTFFEAWKNNKYESGELVQKINGFYEQTALNGKWPVIELARRRGKSSDDVSMTAMRMLLRGTVFMRAGDELEEGLDSSSGYMKWTNVESTMCDFTANKNASARLPKPNCRGSVQEAFAHGSHVTKARVLQDLAKLREEPSFEWGSVSMMEDAQNANLVSYVREASGFDGFLVAVCFKSSTFDLRTINKVPAGAEVEYFYTPDDTPASSEFKKGMTLLTDRIMLKSGQILVLRFSRDVKPPKDAKKPAGPH